MIEELVYYPTLPAMPNEWVEAVDAYNFNEVQARQFDRYCSRDGVAIPNSVYARHPANEKISAWVEKNIGSDYTDIGISAMGAPGGVFLPHTDKTRDWTLIWLLEEGGPEVDTIYWQEENQPVTRLAWQASPTSYDNLTEIARVRLKRGQWHLLNSHVLHSIEGFTTGSRKSLQIGFRDSAESIRRLKATSMIK